MNTSRSGEGGRRRSAAPRAGGRRDGRCRGSGRRNAVDPGPCLFGGPRAALQGFRRDTRGSVTIVAAIGISILVATLAVLMGIVHEIYIEDRMGRGVRAGARAVSLLATAPASEAALKDVVCKAVGRELGEDEGEDCACWSIEVEAFETPKALSDDSARGSDAPPGGENEDMVLVRLRRPYGDWLSGPDDTDSETDSDRCPPVDPDASEAAGIVVAALARNERAIRVSR